MEKVIGPRRSGRTSELIKRSAEAEARGEVSYIVCHNHNEAYRIAELAKRLDFNIGFPLTYSEFLQKQYAGVNIKKFFIDNTELLLQELSVVHIDAIVLLENG